MRRLPFLIALALAGCSAVAAREAKTKLVGLDRVALDSCAGIPNKTEQLGSHDTILTYDMEAKGGGMSAGVPLVGLPIAGTISLNSQGQCVMVAHLIDGKVATIKYTQADGGIMGPLSPCAHLVEGCLGML